MRLNAWSPGPLRQARSLILDIIQSSKTPVTVHEIYKRAVQQELGSTPAAEPPAPASASSTEAPYPDHLIKSMSYLKRVVLPSLARTNEVEKVHSVQTLTPEQLEQRLKSMSKTGKPAKAVSSPTADVWVWKLKDPSPPRPAPSPKSKQVFGWEVGNGEDWSHLNKRRQRKREEKIGADVRWLRDLEWERVKGRREAEAAAKNATSPEP